MTRRFRCLRRSFPFSETEVHAPGPVAPVTTQQIVQQLNQLQAAGVPISPQTVNLAAAIAAALNSQAVSGKVRLERLAGAYIESTGMTDVFLTDLTLERLTINTASGPQEGLKQEVLWQRWEIEA